MTSKSPLDLRDYLAEKVLKPLNTASIPTRVSLRDRLSPPRDQARTSMCTAFAAAGLKEIQEKDNQVNDVSRSIIFSPTFIYSYREAPFSEGMFIRDAMRVLKDYGCCIESMYPFSSSGKSIKYQLANEDAVNFKIDSYYLVESLEDAKKSLTLGNPLLISFPYYQKDYKFYENSSGTSGGRGHCVLIVGFDDVKGTLECRNSWGDKWNSNGYFDIPYDKWNLKWDCYGAYDSKTIGYKIKNIEAKGTCNKCTLC